MQIRWKSIGCALATFVATVTDVSPVHAGAIDRAKLIVPLGAGGALDRMARSVAEALPTTADIEVVIENHDAKDGRNGYEEFLRRAPDGATWLAWFEPAAAAARPANFFEEVAIINVQEIEPAILATSRSTGWKSLDDMMQSMQAQPGRFRLGIGGRMGGGSLLTQTLLARLGIEASVIDYGSGGKARKALLRDEVDLTTGSLKGIRKMGDHVVPLAVFSPRRMRAWPEIPTIAQALGDRSDAAVVGAVYRFIAVHRSFADANPDAFEALVQDLERTTASLKRQDGRAQWFGPEESTSLLQRAHGHFVSLINQIPAQ